MSSDDSEGDKQVYKKAFLDNNYNELILLLNNNIKPTTTELLFILEHNQYIADCIALKNINDLKSFLNISA